MKVLLTGGSGFVGINIAEAILAGSNDVIVFDSNLFPQQALYELSKLPGKLEIIQGDILNIDKLNEVFASNKISCVVHAAAITPGLIRERDHMHRIIDVNIKGTLNILNVSNRHNIEKFIYISSIAVYGSSAQDYDPIYEEVNKRPHTTYEISKFAAECFVQRFSELHNMNAVSLRLGDVFGAWEYHSSVRDTLSAPFQCLHAALHGKRVSLQKEASTGWVYSKDCGNAVNALILCKKFSYFAYNCGSIYRWTMKQWCEMLKKQYPEFDFKLGEARNTSIRFHSLKDNGMLSMTRLFEDTGFVPEFDIDKSFSHYIAWVEKYPELSVMNSDYCQEK